MRSCLEIYGKTEREGEVARNRFSAAGGPVYGEDSPYAVSFASGGADGRLGKGVSLNGETVYPGPVDTVPDGTCTPRLYRENFLTDISYGAGNVADNDRRKALVNANKYDGEHPYVKAESVYDGQFYIP